VGGFWGCDLDRPSIEWDIEHLSPPFQFFVNELAPPLPLPSGSLDLIWAMSVFTHITDGWAEWLAEMHRLLAPGGTLIASYLGHGMWEPLVGDPYREDDLGMAVLRHWEGPDAWVFHSEWWLREHWGRGFEILELRQPARDASRNPEITHSYAVLSRGPGGLVTPADLERIDPGEPREIAGLQTSLRLARREQAQLARDFSAAKAARRWGRRLAARVTGGRSGHPPSS
jgi:SAM-dependent methyltransferase